MNIRQAWTHSDSGLAFMAALAAEGMTLCRGDKRDFIVMDGEGGLHALGKRLLDATAGATRERLADIDRSSLPTIDAAREGLARKAPHLELKDIDQEETRRQGHGATATDNAGMVAQNAEANRRHLELNPFLQAPGARPDLRPERSSSSLASEQRPSFGGAAATPEDRQRRIDENAKTLDEHWHPPDPGLGRDL